MRKGTWNVIGIMSGTSLDGVDLAYIKFDFDKIFSYKIIKTDTIPYTNDWKKKLNDAFTASALEITYLNVTYGKYLGKLVNDFISKNNINNIDFVASHGHTIFHNPTKGFTLQIGDGATLAQTCKQKVVCDFRSQDIAMGGQGAPLVPIGDKLLFSTYDYCINIGGFANISSDKDSERQAFDICPANIVLNHYTRKIGLEYDDKGQMAETGVLNLKLLTALNSIPIYQNKLSMGNEIIVSNFIPLIDSFKLSLEDILHTHTEHIALKIAKELRPNSTAYITGGGAFNDFLIKRIKAHTTSNIIIPESTLINYKEALIFGFLGLLRMENEANCLASVTGAYKNHSSGLVYTP